ncbi:SGNH/GDSL hydrolase family protein [Streptomyces sp. NPDC014622]|uniref:SGNH/GDSL hydrolase family protein n=1 Tax=Streptomyces sp. NPDC014622 TaxID=3364874 RepID=UPI0036FB0878
MAKSGAPSQYYSILGLEKNISAEWNGGVNYPADLVIYTAAPNDARQNIPVDEWSKNVAKYLSTVRAVDNGKTDILFCLPHNGNHDLTNFVYQDYVARGRGLADAYGAAFIDLWSIGRNSWDYWNSLGYWGDLSNPGAVGTDVIHMSDAGHKFMADTVLPVLNA